MDNRTIANLLTAHANQLVRERENLYRVRAYRRAVQTVLALEAPVADILRRGGSGALASLPGIGAHLAYTLERLLLTGAVVPHPRSRSARVRYASAPDRGSKVA